MCRASSTVPHTSAHADLRAGARSPRARPKAGGRGHGETRRAGAGADWGGEPRAARGVDGGGARTAAGGFLAVVNRHMPWVELIDPGTGQPYYYNEETGQTAIDRPAGRLGKAKAVAVYHQRARLPAGAAGFDPEEEERRVQGIRRRSAPFRGPTKAASRRAAKPKKRSSPKRRSSSRGSRRTRAKGRGRGRGRGTSSRTQRRGRGRGRK